MGAPSVQSSTLRVQGVPRSSDFQVMGAPSAKGTNVSKVELSCDFQFKGARFNSEVDRRSEVEITDAPSIKRGPSSYKNSGLPYRRESI